MQLRLVAPLLLALLFAACRSTNPYQGLEGADLHALAEREYAEGDYTEVQRALNRLFIAFPSYERSPEARLLLADSYFADEQYITSASEYRRFIDRYPADPRAAIAGIGLCKSSAATSPDIQRDQSATEDAQQVCRNVAADYTGTPQGEEAARIAEEMRVKLAQKLHTIGEYYFRRNFNDSAIIYWQMVETQYADTEWAPKSLLGILRAYEEIGYADLVEETRQKILTSYPASPEARELSAPAAPAPGTGADA